MATLRCFDSLFPIGWKDACHLVSPALRNTRRNKRSTIGKRWGGRRPAPNRIDGGIRRIGTSNRLGIDAQHKLGKLTWFDVNVTKALDAGINEVKTLLPW